MIVYREIEGRTLYMPVMYDAERDVYVPVSVEAGAGKEWEEPLQAAQAALDHLVTRLKPLWLSAQKLRALCEHPKLVDFRADGISGAVVADEARQLTKLMEFAWTNLVCLLDELGPEAVVATIQGEQAGDAKEDIPEGLLALRKLERAIAAMHTAIRNVETLSQSLLGHVSIEDKEDPSME